MQLRRRVTGLVSALLIATVGSAVYMYQHDQRNVTEYAQILSVDPVMESQTIRMPRQVCVDSIIADSQADSDRSGTIANMPLDSSLVATVSTNAGSKRVSPDGGIRADAIRKNLEPNSELVDPLTRPRAQRDCHTITDVSSRQHATSYKVTYRYNGELHTIEIDHPPTTTRLPIVDGVAVIKRIAGDSDG